MLIEEGMVRRVKQSTQHNEASSRSHAILQFTVRKHFKEKGGNVVQDSKLYMVDLAGN